MPDPIPAVWWFAVGCAALAGCRRSDRGGRRRKNGAASEERPNLDARIGGFEAVLPDDSGKRWVVVRGTAARLDDREKGRESRGVVVGSEAVLHRNGLPVATLTAPEIVADRQHRTVTARGRVRATAQSSGSRTILEADRMVWSASRDELAGNGNVELRQDSNAVVPAERFRADSRLTRIRFDFGPQPAIGKY